ncbi:hypothetical protein C8F04DRAFT_1185832, partial [Mycena alexandri]
MSCFEEQHHCAFTHLKCHVPISASETRISGVPQVPLDFFHRSLLPSITDWVAPVEELLAQAGHIVAGRWNLQSPHPSSSRVACSGELEAEIVHIFDKIVGAGEEVSQRPSNAPLLIGLPIQAAPTQLPSCDAEIRVITRSPAFTTPYATAVPWRLKSMRRALESNEREIIWSCQDVLREDPCRRFSFGVTVDGLQLRIWFFSRSHELVSSPFDAISDVSDMIRLVLSLAFATPEQLGYDTTMSHFTDETGSPQIRLKVAETFYVTKKLLSDNHSDSICGRTTRVWEAYREDDPNQISVAVKDLWTTADAIQEGVQLMELRDKLHALPDSEVTNPEVYFLTVLDHGFVRTSDGADDHTLTVMARGSLPPLFTPKCPRKHYRIVFKEVGTPIHRLQSLSEVMRALADATQALRFLFRLGLVHRDVSAGNILLVDGLGKLSDLEFARPFKGCLSQEPGDHCIGTANYTAGEAAAGLYSYVLDACKPIGARRSTEKPAFRFNPFHDVESTLWIGIWVILYHRRDDAEFKELFDRYFPSQFSDITLEHRMLAISCGFLSLEESDAFCPAMDILHDARRQLYKQYTAFEGDLAKEIALLDEEAPS